MSDLLGIGSSALAAYRTALNTIGENVANAHSPGFARRSVVLTEATVATGGDLVYRPEILFGGVRTVGIERAWDGFLATEARHAASAAARTGVRQQWLTNIETALDDGEAGVGASMTSFFTAAAALASDPGDRLGRRSLLAALDSTAAAFRGSAATLARLSDGIRQSAELEATALNNALKALADVNGALISVGNNGTARASLEDERDRLLEFIAGELDVAVTIAGDGRTTLGPAGDPTLQLLSGNGPGLVTLEAATDGRLAFHLTANGTKTPLPAAGGAVAALAEMSTTIADRRAELDALAADFATLVNDWSAAGLDENGDPGVALFDASAGAVAMTGLVADPALVPAAGTDGTLNGNLLALDGVRIASRIEARWTALVSSNAQSLAAAKSEAAAASRRRDNSLTALDEVSEVDLDFEAAELLRFQQAYNAAARIVQVARESIQALFDAL